MCVLLCLSMVFAMAACGTSSSKSVETSAPADEATKAVQEAETTAELSLDDPEYWAKRGAACPDDELVIYSAVFEDQTEAVCAAFEEATGIKTSCVVLGGGEILARVRAEKENATASLWFGGPCDSHITAKNEGLLLQYETEFADVVAPKYKDVDNYWVGTYIGYVGFVINQERIAELGVKSPESWEDLLQEGLAGEIMFASPTASSTGYVILATVLQLMGEEEGWKYMEALDANVMQYTERGSACITSVISGECAVGICFIHDAITKIEGNPGSEAFTTYAVPSEGTGYETGAMAILADGPNLEAAKVFYDWALTAEAQEINQVYGAYQFLTNPEAQNPPQTASIASAETIEYDTTWAGNNKEDFQAKWAGITGR